MKSKMLRRRVVLAGFAVLLLAASPASWAQPWVSFDDNTRYMALGDSLSAGYAAKPATQGFVFRLYQSGVIDNLNNLLFCAAAVPNAASADVLNYQVPQVHLFFKDTGKSYKKVVTLTVGGNDALSVLGPSGDINFAGIPGMLSTYANNLLAILTALSAPGDVRVYVGNLYDPKLPVPGEELLVAAINQVIANVVGLFPGKVVLVDLYSAFLDKSGLLLIEKHGSGPDQIHPTDAGYGVMASAFKDAIAKH